MEESDNLEVGGAVSKCPRCSSLLEEGYILAPRGLFWDKNKRVFWAIGSERLVSQWSLSVPSRPAQRCYSCKLVIFSYD